MSDIKRELAALSLNLFHCAEDHPDAMRKAVDVGRLARDFNNSTEQPKVSKGKSNG